MSLGKELLFFFSALGVFNGLLISGYLLFRKNERTISRLFLSLLILTLSIRIGKSVMLIFFKDVTPQTIIQVGLSACLLIGPFSYYYVRSSLQPYSKIPQKWKYVILGFLFILIVLGSIFPLTAYYALWQTYIIKGIYTVWSAYVIASVYIYWKYVKNKNNPPIESSLLKGVLIGSVAILISYLISVANWVKGSYISGSILFSFILYLNIYLFFSRKKQTNITHSNDQKKYQIKKIDDKNAVFLSEKLERLLKENELYKNPDLKLSDVSALMKISSHQLSQLLNDNMGKSFSTYINEYRIQDACKKIVAESNIKIEEIGYEVGFNSKSTFFTTFKKIMNTTPTLYRASLEEAG